MTATVCGYSLRQHLGIDVGQALPHGSAGRTFDFLHQGGHLLRRQQLRQELRGAVERAVDGAGRGQAADEFEDEFLDDVGVDVAELHHRMSDDSDFILVERFPNRLAIFGAEGEQDHGRPLGAGHLVSRDAFSESHTLLPHVRS
jgi:hypothetical protein